MKSLIIAITFSVASLFTASANDHITPSLAEASFQRSYANALNVHWSRSNTLSKVSFLLDGKWFSAYYNVDGSLVAVTRNVSSLELPKALQAGLKGELKGSWISELFVVTTEEGDTYYVRLEDRGVQKTLKSEHLEKWIGY